MFSTSILQTHHLNNVCRKETIERIFGTAKENHGFRYTQDVWKSADGNESRAHVYVYEFQKVSKDQAGMELGNGLIQVHFNPLLD